MMRFELLNEVWATAKRNKLRTTLTGFSVAWGIFILIFLLGAGNGLINATMQQQTQFLSNSMVVFGGKTSKAYKGLKEGRPITLRNADLTTTERGFADNIDEVGALLSQEGVTIAREQQYVSLRLTGVYPNYPKIDKIEMLCGRFINQIDINEQRKVLVMDSNHARELRSDFRNLIGEHIKVDNMAFRVVGIYKTDESEQNNDAYTAHTTIQRIYAKQDQVGDIQFTFHGLPTQEANDTFENKYRARINSNHQAAPNDNSAIWLWNRYTQNMQMSTGIGIIRTALWIIGLFTLLSGVVGVSNIMLITVKERTHEFGIRKAIGATPWAILKLIIVESVIITTIFGYIGMLCGILANEYMDATIGHLKTDTGIFQATMFLNPTVGLDVCFEATLVIIIAGTIAGLIPARKAVKIRPIEALMAH